MGTVWACVLTFVWLREKFHAGEWYYEVVGSCEVRFSTSSQPDKNLYVCVTCVVTQTLKQNNSRLENRTQLVTLSHVRMGPKVFINCAGFIKIDTKELSDRYTHTDTHRYTHTDTHRYTHTHTHTQIHTLPQGRYTHTDTHTAARQASDIHQLCFFTGLSQLIKLKSKSY